MAWAVEQQAKSGLGQLEWLKVAGPFDTQAQAEKIAGRLEGRHGLPARVVPAPRPAAGALDHLHAGRPCRIIEQPRRAGPGQGRGTVAQVEFADGSQASVSIFELRKAG